MSKPKFQYAIVSCLFICLSLLFACKTAKTVQKTETTSKEDIKVAENVIQTPAMIQAAADRKIIQKFVAQKNWDAKETESGLFYVIEEEGNGEHPTRANKVKVHYRGTLLDGTEFDSSYKRGEPAMFPLASVVKGWQEGIPLLKTGGKGKLIIPSGLAYGTRGVGELIKPNSVLVFDIELLEIVQPHDPREQGLKDEKIIQQYLADNGIEAERTNQGIYYIIEKEGTGERPVTTDKVKVHYRGMLLDGTEFDSSYSRNQPSSFPLKGVIKGWQFGIPMLKVGGKGRLIIPSGMAYGPMGRRPQIPENAILIFDVELLEIVK